MDDHEVPSQDVQHVVVVQNVNVLVVVRDVVHVVDHQDQRQLDVYILDHARDLVQDHEHQECVYRENVKRHCNFSTKNIILYMNLTQESL